MAIQFVFSMYMCVYVVLCVCSPIYVLKHWCSDKWYFLLLMCLFHLIHVFVYHVSSYHRSTGEGVGSSSGPVVSDQMDNIADIREYDVPYHVRVAIDRKINVVSILIGLIEQCWYIHIYQGHWYYVKGCGSTEPPEIRLVDEEPDRPVSIVDVCHTNLHVQCIVYVTQS